MSENIFINIKYIFVPLQVNEQTRAENGETAVILFSEQVVRLFVLFHCIVNLNVLTISSYMALQWGHKEKEQAVSQKKKKWESHTN